MPRIDPYVQQGTAFVRSPVPGRQAEGGDFGGPGMRMLGETIADETYNVWRVSEEAKARQEVTDAQTRLSEFGAQAALQLDQRARTTPIEEHGNFAVKFSDDLEGPLRKLGEKYETRAGQEAFQRGAGELTGHFIKQAGVAQIGRASCRERV